MCDIYTGLRLDEAHVKAGRETEVKRMLEFEVYEEVTRPGEVETGGTIKSEVHASAATCLRPHHQFQQCVLFLSRAASRGHGRCLGLWDVSVAFFHAAIEKEVFVRPPKNMRKDKTIWKLLKSHLWHTSCKFTLAKSVAYNEIETHWRCFTETTSWPKVTTSHWTSWMKCWTSHQW